MLIYYWKMLILYQNLKWFYVSYKKRIEIQKIDFTLCTQGTKNSLNLKVIFSHHPAKNNQSRWKISLEHPWTAGQNHEIIFCLELHRISVNNRFHQSNNSVPTACTQRHLPAVPVGTKREMCQLRVITPISGGPTCKPGAQVTSPSSLGDRTGTNLSPSPVTFPVLPAPCIPATETTFKFPSFPFHLQPCIFLKYVCNPQKCFAFKTF